MLVHDLPWNRVLRGIAPQIIEFALISASAVAISEAMMHPEVFGIDASLPERIRAFMAWDGESLPFGAVAAMGSSLAIFLGFRNSSAYNRWWEARKIWGALVNDSRSWARQCLAWVEDPAVARELIHRHLAIVHGLAPHHRQHADVAESIQHFVPDNEHAHYARVPNVPTALLMRQGKRVAEAHEAGVIERFHHLWMDELLTRLSDVQGKCERIKNTPLPRQYDAIPRVFVYVYGAMLPFGLAPTIGWMTIPVSLIITIMFLLLEISGRVLEDPFDGNPTDTPMTALSITIERDLRAALAEPLPDPVVPDKDGVVM
ncbi:MAG: bestrophin family protein [Myxococcota bacterium]